jgi:hypothetical protein
MAEHVSTKPITIKDIEASEACGISREIVDGHWVSARFSNGKRQGRGNTKNGHNYVSWAFVEAANFAVRSTPQIKRYSQRKMAQTDNIVATKTVAHTLARACFSILRDQGPFDVKRTFGPTPDNFSVC